MLKLIGAFCLLIIAIGCTPESTPELEQLNPPVFKDGVAELRMTPTQPLVEREIELQLSLAEGMIPGDSVVRGVSMNMGTIPVRWQRQSNSWIATLFVGACSDPQMIWELVVPLHFEPSTPGHPDSARPQQRQTVRFEFQTQQG